MFAFRARTFDRLALAGDDVAVPISYPTTLRRGPVAGWNRLVKRIEDIAFALPAPLLFAIPMILIAAAIRLDSAGPAIFRQRRIGLDGRPFEMLKFRTMYHAADRQDVCRQATRHDPRVTRVGALLRRLSFDELPQLFNVLRADMSLVGPRPHAPGTCAAGQRFEEVTQLYTARHRVKPGMTGLAQVRGWRGETDTLEKFLHRIDSDLEYIETWCLALDLRIICRTVFTVLRMRNAY
jgi:exopolysaccharide biosynthesis polyprenyl glycosylphosphotransferase